LPNPEQIRAIILYREGEKLAESEPSGGYYTIDTIAELIEGERVHLQLESNALDRQVVEFFDRQSIWEIKLLRTN
jgi:hypothetical protein